MRNTVLIYCMLTLFFTGGCAIVLLGLRSGPGQPPREVLQLTGTFLPILGLSFLANAVFLGMVTGKTTGRLMMGSAIAYVLAQLALALLLGPTMMLALTLLPLLVGKGAAVAVLGVMRDRGVEDRAVQDLAQEDAARGAAKGNGRDEPGHDDQR